MYFEKAVMDALDLGYEVTLMQDYVLNAIKVVILWRDDGWACVSGVISMLEVEDSRNGYALAHFIEKLTSELQAEVKKFGCGPGDDACRDLVPGYQDGRICVNHDKALRESGITPGG